MIFIGIISLVLLIYYRLWFDYFYVNNLLIEIFFFMFVVCLDFLHVLFCFLFIIESLYKMCVFVMKMLLECEYVLLIM